MSKELNNIESSLDWLKNYRHRYTETDSVHEIGKMIYNLAKIIDKLYKKDE